ncbi:receptor-like protein 2 [Pyrus ussuriensis x Pyrus communis]|uniref:Receptor-like protein 2 n=1 Tax=Pyrus ussuriensis x Pyrus communis TaxID=2448454 RepID=A0A5N5GK77_9ROSA|nr:receptor-like protein 2 [Pyrus ussuriensis x Pyrus communis]
MNCTSLAELHLGRNNLEGDITKLNFSKLLPTSLYSCRSLKAIRLSSNNLEGQVQSDILSLNSLSFLSLSYNRLENVTGAMKILMHCKSLRALILSDSFNGEGMPSDNNMLKSLEILALGGNKITGTIPSWLGTDLPRLFHRLVNEPYFRSSNFPPFLDLSFNNITGNIPTEIGQLQVLQGLYLNDNNFSGIIPEQISNLKNLEGLDLSKNRLSGKIPSSLVSLNFLKNFDVSYNNLEGPIPTSTQFQSFEASAFDGNPKLCGAPLPNKCHIDVHDKNKRDDDEDNQNDEDDRHQLPWFYVSVVLGFIFGFWGVCGSLIAKKTWRYAYFQFIDNVQDRLFVMLADYIALLIKSIHSQTRASEFDPLVSSRLLPVWNNLDR